MTTYTNLTACIPLLAAGKIGIVPTDTLYGIVAAAHNPDAVQQVYDLKGRNPDKPCIILVASPTEITTFGVPQASIQQVARYWPAPLSIIFDGIKDQFAYLHRGTGTLSFRVPASAKLRAFLAQTGPLIAPSANPQGATPAATAAEAQRMFSDHAAFYADGGKLSGQPSTVARLQNDGNLEVLRQGAFQLPA